MNRKLESAKARPGDPAELASLKGKVEGLEGERDALRRDVQESQATAEELREKVGRLMSRADRPGSAGDSKPGTADPKAAAGTLADVVARCSPAVVLVKTDAGVGAGFFLTPDGLAVTNYHVIARSALVLVGQVEGTGGTRAQKELGARVVAVDLKNDLALLKVKAEQPVPVLELADPESLRAGDEVFAIGNPGLGSVILDQSVTNGVLSSLERVIEGTAYIQTSVPINPGNSGGPLINRDGRVVGVVTAKGMQVENIGFALPASVVRGLLENRDGDFAVKGPLSEWEASRGIKFAHDASAGIPVDALVSKIVVDAERDRILCLDYTRNGVTIVSISKRRILRTIHTGSEPIDLVKTGNPDVVWISHVATKIIARVDLKEGKVLERFETPRRHGSFVVTPNHLWTWGGSNSVVFRKDAKGYETSADWRALAYDARRDLVLAILASSQGMAIVEFDPDKMAPVLKDLAEFDTRKRNASSLEELQEKLLQLVKIHPTPSEGGEILRESTMPTLVCNGSARLYVNRLVLRLDKPEKVAGIVKSVLHSRRGDPAINLLLQQIPQADRIRAASSNLKWIATATHLHSGESFEVHKELPVPAPAMDFTADSKVLYIFDALNRTLLPIDVESK